MSGAFSLSRENRMSKRPEVVAQEDASTDTSAVHLRSIVSGWIFENCTSRNARTGLHPGPETAGGIPARPMQPARTPRAMRETRWLANIGLLRLRRRRHLGLASLTGRP